MDSNDRGTADSPARIARRAARPWAGCLLAPLAALALAGCEPPEPDTPRPTAPVILEFTPAPTYDVDATATSYARQLIPTPTPSGLYVVQAGDTLGALAEEFGTTVEEIMAANGLTDPDAIQVGQTLIIPSLASRPLATAAPISPTVPTPTPTPTETPTRRPPTETPVPPPPTETPVPPTEAPPPPPPTETLAPVPLDATPVEPPPPTISTP